MRYFPVIVMGVSSVTLQILCLRRLLTTFSGNELTIGLTLAVWLITVSLGSYTGAGIRSKNAFGASFLLLALVSQPTFLLIGNIRPLLGFEAGEVIHLPATLLWTSASVAALCIIIGVQFPLAVSYLKDKASQVYSLEALGAFSGGLIFTFFLAGRVSSESLVTILATVNILISVFLSGKRILVPLLLLPFVFHAAGDFLLHPSGFKGAELIQSTESRYGEIRTVEMANQYNLYYSGNYLFSYPDVQSEELAAHLPMSLSSSAGKLLVVGGSPAVIREFLKYPVSGIDFVEIDPVLIDVSREILSPDDDACLDDRRVTVLHTDARRYIKTLRPGEYDLITLNLPEPSTANINRYYTADFFKEAGAVLRKTGVLYLRLPVSYGYIGRRMQVANGSVYSSLGKVFSHVYVSSEEYGIMAASMSPLVTDPDTLSGNFSRKQLHTFYFRPYILNDAFSPEKVEMVKTRLAGVRDVNTDRRPVSYLYNLMLWTEIYGGAWLNPMLGMSEYAMLGAAVSVLIMSAVFFVRKKKIIFHTMFTTGYFVMAFCLVTILAFQAHAGYIYEQIGLLTGIFMLGSAVGAGIFRKSVKPALWLKLLDVTAILLLAASLLFLENNFIYYMGMFSVGVLGGGQFAAASLSLRQQGYGGTAGRLYAVDLAGSFLGSFVTAVFMVPMTGIENTILFLICVKTLSAALLALYEKT